MAVVALIRRHDAFPSAHHSGIIRTERWACSTKSAAGNALEPDGYITFYTVDRGNDEAPGGTSELREYRARFSSGKLQNIVRADADGACVRYGLASFRWFEPRSFLFDVPQ
jgi:hypothetical protein